MLLRPLNRNDEKRACMNIGEHPHGGPKKGDKYWKRMAIYSDIVNRMELPQDHVHWCSCSVTTCSVLLVG